MDLALNNLQRLMCHKTQQTKPKLCGLQSPENSLKIYQMKCRFKPNTKSLKAVSARQKGARLLT